MVIKRIPKRATSYLEVNKTGILCANPDGNDHISARPTKASMKAWIKAGSDSFWTRALKAIVVKYVGGY